MTHSTRKRRARLQRLLAAVCMLPAAASADYWIDAVQYWETTFHGSDQNHIGYDSAIAAAKAGVADWCASSGEPSSTCYFLSLDAANKRPG